MAWELHSGTAAEYGWNSHLARFAALTPVEKQSIPKFLAALFQNVASWETNAEFRAVAALIHEIVHWLQDTTTGAGCRDFLTRRRGIAVSLHCLKQSADALAGNEQLLAQSLREMAADYLSSLKNNCAFVSNADYPIDRRHQLREGMSETVGKQVPEDDVEPFLMENMLEAEAAAVTMLTIRNLKMSDEQFDIANDNAGLWRFDQMPAVYTRTLVLFQGVFEHWMGGEMSDLRKELGEWIYGYFLELFVFLVDLSCALPDPDQVATEDAAWREYDPGLKLVRLVAALQWMTAAEVGPFHKAVFDDRGQAEASLLKRCTYPYPTSKQIYGGWLKHLEHLAQESDDRMLRARLHTCGLRSQESAELGKKRLPSLISEKLDLLYVTASGIRGFWTSPAVVDHDEQQFVVADLMALNRDFALAEYLLHSDSFTCPAAEARICSAATPTCKSGISSASQFPTHNCLVREALSGAGLPLERLKL